LATFRISSGEPVRFLDEIEPAAMHRDQRVRVQLADLGDDLGQIIGRGRAEVEAAHGKIGPALASSTQENPPAAAAAAKPADIFKASRRLRFGIAIFLNSSGSNAALRGRREIQGRFAALSIQNDAKRRGASRYA
jgi:hypothetical protein